MSLLAKMKVCLNHKSIPNVFLKLINNSSLNKRNHDREGVWISDLN